MPQNVDIVPKKPSADLSEFSDSFVVGDKNLDTVIQDIEPLINDAYTAMSNYLDAALTRKAEMKSLKDEILAARKAAAEANEIAAVDAATEAYSTNMSGDYVGAVSQGIGTYIGTKLKQWWDDVNN